MTLKPWMLIFNSFVLMKSHFLEEKTCRKSASKASHNVTFFTTMSLRVVYCAGWMSQLKRGQKIGSHLIYTVSFLEVQRTQQLTLNRA